MAAGDLVNVETLLLAVLVPLVGWGCLMLLKLLGSTKELRVVLIGATGAESRGLVDRVEVIGGRLHRVEQAVIPLLLEKGYKLDDFGGA